MRPPLVPLLHSYLRTASLPWRFRTREQLERWQQKALKKQLARLKKDSPFYRAHEGFPPMDKRLMMQKFDQLNTQGLRKKELLSLAMKAEESRDFSATYGPYTVGLSSGTSGNRGLFVVSPSEQAQWAGQILARMLPKPPWHPQRVALFLRAGGPLYESTGRGRIQFRFFDLFVPVAEQLDALQAFNPTVLVAPPSVLQELVLADVSPEKVVSVAEVLDPFDEKRLEAQFGKPIHQIYQATEGCIASTCSKGTLHLHEDLLLIEREELDEERFVPVLTDLYRQTQPIVRYRLDDILVKKASPCTCGCPMLAIERIEGRCDDILIFPKANGAGSASLYPDFIRRAIIQASEEILEYRVIQKSEEVLEVALKVIPEQRSLVEAQVSQALNALLQQFHARVPEIRFTAWTPPALGAKRRRVYRESSHAD